MLKSEKTSAIFPLKDLTFGKQINRQATTHPKHLIVSKHKRLALSLSMAQMLQQELSVIIVIF